MPDAAFPLQILEHSPRDPGAVEPDEKAVLRALAQGAGQVAVAAPPPQAQPGLRRLTLFVRTVQETLQDGQFQPDVPASGGLKASQRFTRERGAILFIENPTAMPATGSVFPYLPEVTLAPGEVLAWVHDCPIVRSREELRQPSGALARTPGRYLDAYVGLVKSDAALLAAHIRPDPFAGARVFVYAPPGTTGEVVLFHDGGRAQNRRIAFASAPQCLDLGPSQIVALSPELAAMVEFDANVTRIGPYQLDDNGEWSVRWHLARVTVPAATDARLDLDGRCPIALQVNGQPVFGQNLTLEDGENEIALIAPSADAPVDALLLPEGACYVQEIRHWRAQMRPLTPEGPTP